MKVSAGVSVGLLFIVLISPVMGSNTEDLVIEQQRIDYLGTELYYQPAIYESKIGYTSTVGSAVFNIETNQSKVISYGAFQSLTNEYAVVVEGEASELHIVDLATNQNISTGIQKCYSPQIHHGNVIFSNGSKGYSNNDIYLYNLTTGEERAICTNNATQTNPDIWGDYVVWTDYRHGTYNDSTGTWSTSDVYLYDLDTGEERRVSWDEGYEWSVGITHGLIVYTKGEIILYDIGSNTTRRIEDTHSARAVYDDYILWVGDGCWIYSISRDESYKIMEEDNIWEDLDLWENRVVGVKDGDIWLLEFELPEPERIEDEPTVLEQYWWIIVAGAVAAAVVVVAWRRRR